MIITRTLALALICASAWGLSPIAPLQTVGDNNDCALYLNGPGRSSAYDYSINLLKGNLGYEGQANCITYEAINQAYVEARNRILVAQPKGDWKAEDFASVGELVLDISINLARRYGLTYEEIEKGLPLIDTSKTLIREVCPPVFSHVECRAGKYRRLDGLCNNLQHPTWGATMAPFQRLIGPLFSDGINAPRIAHHGRDLPLSRVVSRTMHPDDGFHDHAGTVMVIAWGQFMDHDYTLTATPLDPINRNDPEECCKRPPHLKHPYCNEIRIPDDDYFYRLFGVKCIDFVRGFPSPRPGCRLGSRVPYNTLTGVIDGNTVYGVTEKFARKLRTGFGGILRMNPVFKEYGLRDLLPLKLDIPDEGCTRPNKNMYCFEAGEIRVNEQLVLTVMHTLMAREHNRIANALAEVNPHWDDETLYQESRRINIAEIQHITYNEFLPILLGKDVMEKFGLVLEKEGYWDGYDPEVNPDVIASFAAAAYRFGHSLLPTAVERWSKAHKFIASKRLSDLIRRPYDLYRAGVLDEYIMGLMNQVAQAMDDSITQEVTNHLFKKVGARFGMDLVSFNMQRGREFGLPGYMEFRKFCGLPPAETFQDLFGSMPNQTVQKYETIFDHPIDVDLWSGGVSERPLPGSMLGPTFACIIATQFSYSRRGDRFWFELPNQPSSFTPEQLAEIKKSRLARVICDNTDIIDTVQLYPMVLPDHELNPRVPCRSGVMPQMDFSKWAEPAPFNSAKQFMTHAAITENNFTKFEEVKGEENYNITETPDIVTQNPAAILLQEQITDGDKTNNTITNNIDLPSEEYTEQIKNNEITNNDTVLKYVYKKGEKTDQDKKSKGHFKNSLKRRKRSPADLLSPLPSKFQKPALIVDYETSHGPSASSNWSPPLKSASIINDQGKLNIKNRRGRKYKSLRKDSIENLNDGSNESNDKEQYNQNSSNDSRESDESEERSGYNRKQKYSTRDQNRAESSESDSKNDRPYLSSIDIHNDRPEKYSNKNSNVRSPNSKESNESSEKQGYANIERPDIDSHENIRNAKYNQGTKHYRPRVTDDSIEHSKENSHESRREFPSSNEDSNNSKYTHSNSPKKDKENHQHHTYVSARSSDENSNENSKENSYAPQRKDDRNHSEQRYQNENFESSNENSNDSKEKRTQLPQNNAYQHGDMKNPSKNNNKLPIQDIDLDHFSHERIKLNKNVKVESANENRDNSDPNSAVEIISSDVVKPNTQKHDVLQLVTSIHTPLKDYADKLVQINDGEVRPVVEIHTEQDDNSSEENNKGDSNNSESLESILNGKEPQSEDLQNGKIVAHKEVNTGDVKQQFERIPLNYNHAQKTEKTDEKPKDSAKEDISKVENIPKKEIHTKNSDGTLDEFVPKNENVNIKFDDLHINLPEIKLPKDILAFTKAHSPFHDENNYDEDKKSHYPYDHSQNYKSRDQNKKKQEDDDDDDDDNKDHEDSPAYYGYYGGESEKNQDYKKKNDEDEDDEDEDLYEKFVRERFGKRGTFEKRSENLEERPLNPHLTKTVQNILKKTADIDEQAKKSGDPNAGYMWTLEYGENL